MELLEMLYNLTRSDKSKMAASKTWKTFISACRQNRNEIPTSKTKFSRSSNPMGLSVMLWDQTGSMQTKMASIKPDAPIFQLVNNIGTKFQPPYPRFRGPATRGDKWHYCPTSRYIENRRWRLLTGSRNDITYISACTHDSNETPTTIPMLSGWVNKIILLRRLPDAWIWRELKMVHINFHLTEAIFNSRLIHTSGSRRSGLIV